MWDQSGPERYSRVSLSFYRNASVVLLLIDPSNNFASESMKEKAETIKKHASKAEVILISTKKDKKEKRIISNKQADKFAYDNFESLHLDITNTKLEEPKNIIWYCALLKYLLSP